MCNDSFWEKNMKVNYGFHHESLAEFEANSEIGHPNTEAFL
jgi:hypothetical protein